MNSIGSVISNLRKLLGITQKDLCENICDQSTLSRIEKGAMPYADTLYKIALRLGVDVHYFFENAAIERMDYVDNTFDYLRRLTKAYNYLEIEEVIKKEWDNPIFQSLRCRQILYWYKGMVCYYVHGDMEEAIQLLDKAFHTYALKKIHETQIEIMMTKGNVYSEVNDLHTAIDMYQECLLHYRKLPRVNNQQIMIKLFYNLSLAYSKLGDEEKSIQYCREGIKKCKDTGSLYFLGELYYQLGYSLYYTNQYQIGVFHMEKAIQIFDLIDNQIYVDFTKQKVKEFSEALEKRSSYGQ